MTLTFKTHTFIYSIRYLLLPIFRSLATIVSEKSTVVTFYASNFEIGFGLSVCMHDGVVWCGVVYGVVWCGLWYGMVYGMVWYGMVRYWMAWHGMAW